MTSLKGIDESSFKYVIEVRFFALKYMLHVLIPLKYMLHVLIPLQP